MARPAHLQIDPRLASILGETYRSSEAALKELVDNAWDADAEHIWITLPEVLSGEPIVVQDDGSGMTEEEVRSQYLRVARDRRSQNGDRSKKYGRKIKGRKGIGKFAGLAAARQMVVSTRARGQQTVVEIDKCGLLEATNEIGQIKLPLTKATVDISSHGTTITLNELNQDRSIPTAEALRTLLVYEYGRADGFVVIVNGDPLSVEDVPGRTEILTKVFEGAAEATLRFTIGEPGRKGPKLPGIVIKVAGKVIGRPRFFGLEDDSEIPKKLLTKLYGEVEADALEGHVTANWDAIIENSTLYQQIKTWVYAEARKVIDEEYGNEIDLQRARLQRDIKKRIERLPAYRRQYADEAVQRILRRLYGEREERIEAVVNVLLDGLERDEYWLVLQKINDAKHQDLQSFADALELFGLLELSMVGERARQRQKFLDELDDLIAKPETLEKQVHQAFEGNHWLLGSKYAALASNRTLKRIVEEFTTDHYSGAHASKRPDLFMMQDAADRYLLIEFKRPSHPLTRIDEAQARVYRDELGLRLPGKAIDVLLLGGRRAPMTTTTDTPDIKFLSYGDMLSDARYQLKWLLTTLAA
ncbi:MAG: ATP-binding protein [Hyphomicrobium sp.]